MRAIYAFSGDPITFGHIDIVARAAATYQEVLVAIGENPQKRGRYLFDREQRLAMATRSLAEFPNVRCTLFSGLLAEYTFRHGFDVIVRGVRNAADLDAEITLAAVNSSLHPTLDTVFFPSRPHLSHISSGVVKAIVAEGGDVSQYCPLPVKEELEKAILKRFSVGVAGGIAAGKTHLAEQLVSSLREHVHATYVSLDAIGHYVLGTADEHMYLETRDRIANAFGRHLLQADGAVDRRELGHIVFADAGALNELNHIMREPMLARLYDETRQIPAGVIVLEGAILVEADWTRIVNNNVVLVTAADEVRCQRLMARNQIDEAEARLKISRQLSHIERLALLNERIGEQGWGRVWQIDNENGCTPIAPVTDEIIRLAPSANS
jgi:pantetheine-phosphate adenylyltransferase